MQLAMTVEDLTPQWLTAALNIRYPQVRVESVQVDHVVWGTTAKVLLRATYANPPGPDDPPEALCVKGCFDSKMLDYALANAYVREAGFYANCAGSVATPLPRSWYSASDAATGQGIVILDDLRALGCTFGEPTQPWSVDLVAAGLEALAGLHGSTWGAKPARFPWLGNEIPQREVMNILMAPPYWDKHWASAEAPVVPDRFRDRDLMLRACLANWAFEDKATPVLRHADPHIGNTYIDAQGKPVFVDWQAVCLGPGLDDVAFFMVGGLTVADRRAEERHLMRHYLNALAAAGGPKMNMDDAWLEYQRYQLHGFMWVMTGPMFQPVERVTAMSERFIAGMVDHECFKVLRV